MENRPKTSIPCFVCTVAHHDYGHKSLTMYYPPHTFAEYTDKRFDYANCACAELYLFMFILFVYMGFGWLLSVCIWYRGYIAYSYYNNDVVCEALCHDASMYSVFRAYIHI